jgi:hypothetical protein
MQLTGTFQKQNSVPGCKIVDPRHSRRGANTFQIAEFSENEQDIQILIGKSEMRRQLTTRILEQSQDMFAGYLSRRVEILSLPLNITSCPSLSSSKHCPQLFEYIEFCRKGVGSGIGEAKGERSQDERFEAHKTDLEV